MCTGYRYKEEHPAGIPIAFPQPQMSELACVNGVLVANMATKALGNLISMLLLEETLQNVEEDIHLYTRVHVVTPTALILSARTCFCTVANIKVFVFMLLLHLS